MNVTGFRRDIHKRINDGGNDSRACEYANEICTTPSIHGEQAGKYELTSSYVVAFTTFYYCKQRGFHPLLYFVSTSRSAVVHGEGLSKWTKLDITVSQIYLKRDSWICSKSLY